MGIIYCYTNKINNKKYVGQTINPKQRKSSHKSDAFNPSSKQYDAPLHRAFRKYGYENFSYEVLIDGIDDIFLLNELEIYYIKKLKSKVPNGYNIEAGGNNASHPHTEESKTKLMWSHSKLTEQEVIELRLAYKNKESPSKIYNEKYKERLHYNSFLNIWTGSRYSKVMPEVFEEKKRHTKLDVETVSKIKKDRKELNLSYSKLAKKYNISKSTIADICKGRTWKNV